MASTRKAALVTGAANGIGAAAAIALAKAGYDVAINYSRSDDQAKSVEAEAKKAGAKTILVKTDVSDDAGVRAMLKTVGDTFGRLDALVNNAGITAFGPAQGSGKRPALEEWDRVFAVNVRGMFQVTRACVPLLKEAAHRLPSSTRPASSACAPARSRCLCREQGRRRQPDQDAGAQSRPRDPRQRGRAGLDGRRLDEADAEGPLRRSDGPPRQGDAA